MRYIAPNYDVEIFQADEIMLFNIISTLVGGDTPDDTSDDGYKGSVEVGFDNL